MTKIAEYDYSELKYITNAHCNILQKWGVNS